MLRVDDVVASVTTDELLTTAALVMTGRLLQVVVEVVVDKITLDVSASRSLAIPVP